jgi:hypothetical protein
LVLDTDQVEPAALGCLHLLDDVAMGGREWDDRDPELEDARPHTSTFTAQAPARRNVITMKIQRIDMTVPRRTAMSPGPGCTSPITTAAAAPTTIA